MGGSAIFIDGDVNLAQVMRPGLLGRLLGKKPAEASDLRGDFIDIPAKDFQFIGEEFRAFLNASLAPPWPSTKAIMEYLKFGTKVYLRGQSVPAGGRMWYLQLTFSGCAGMAQTSSELAAHWASLWYAKKAEPLQPLLAREGFTPRALRADFEDGMKYLPIGDLGYASYCAAGTFATTEDPGDFTLDDSVREALGEDADRLTQALKEKCQPLVVDGRCHCQMCDPQLDLEFYRGLPGVS